MLQAHIHKENEILFPMADRVIGSARMKEVARSFDTTQAELAEDARRLEALAEEIARRAG